ncbi:MAG TPA: hypothetical protein VFO55_08270 [Gemmatimonadaceae bacterium]|nr:hypothetical protein [Gemmatimonadaceae bacterium]
MSHLSPERLAAFIDEQPTASELSHLGACRACSRERGAYEALAAMSRSGAAIGQPLTSWDRLAPELARDGVIDRGQGIGRRARISRGWLQAAAAVLLMAGGMALGRVTAPSTPVIDLASLDAPATFASVEQAQALAAKSQDIYQASMAFIAGQDSATMSLATPAAIKTRLAALEQVTQIVGAALEEAPYDSVINTIYLNAQGQREASMRMLNTASTRLTTY